MRNSNYLTKSSVIYRSCAALMLVAFCSFNSMAQLNYTRTTFTGSYASIAGTAAGVTGDDAWIGSIPIGFSFTYNAIAYTTLSVNTNGWLSFTALTYDAANTNMSTTTTNAVLAPWWDDLSSSSIQYLTTGSVGSRIFTMQWVSLSYYTTSTRTINYQVKLYETSNVIEFWYGTVSGTNANGYSSESASIGIKNQTGGLGNFIDAVSGSNQIYNGTLTAGQWPTRNYRFTPGAPTAIAAGTYNVGTGQTYVTLTEAVADINHRGVSGAVTLNLTDATYIDKTAGGNEMFPIVFGPVAGTSATNTVTITGNAADLRYAGSIAGSWGNGTTAGTMFATTAEPILGLCGMDYLTVNNIKLTALTGIVYYTNTGTPTRVDRGLAVQNAGAINGATNNNFNNITITLDRTNTSTLAIDQGNSTVPTSAAGANSTNKYKDLIIKNTQKGISLGGNASFPDIGCEIGTAVCTNFNTIGDPATANDIGNTTTATFGIQATNQQDVKIYNNSVRNVTGSGVQVDGINVVTFLGTSSVYNNKIQTIKNSSTSSTTAIAGIRASHTTTGTHVLRIYNNAVSEIISSYTGVAVTTRTLKGIFIAGTGGTTAESYEVWNNSVSLNATASPNLSSVCFANATSSGPIFIVRNNIFANFTPAQGATAKHYCIETTSATTFGPAGTVCNNNDFWINADQGTSGAVGIGNATSYFTLANWQAGITSPAGTDAASISVDPSYTNTISDLHATASGVNNAGTAPAAYVTVDLACAARTDNDMGAYNIVVTNDDAGVTAIVLSSPFCSGLQTVQATVKNFGAVTLTSFKVDWTITPGGAQPQQTFTSQSVAPGASVTVTLGTFTFTAPTSYSITATSSLPNGNADGNTANDATTQSGIIPGISSGTYTVGAAGNFTTLTAAVASYNQGCISGAIVFNLIDASYPSETYPITINAVAGASATNTLKIKPNTTASISGSLASGALIKLNGADYVTIDGSNSGGTDRSLTITNTNTTSPTAISLVSLGTGLGATNDVVKNCNIATGTTTSTTGYGIAVGGATPGTSGADNDNVTLQNNAITVANVSIYAIGTAAVSAGGDDNLNVNSNSVTSGNVSNTSVNNLGIQLGNTTGSSVSLNTISVTTADASQPVGISCETGFVSSTVTRNNITNVVTTNSGGYGGRGITVGTGSATSNVTVANNFVSGVNGTNWSAFSNSSSLGIGVGVVGSGSLTDATGGVNLYYNTVNMYGSMGTASTTALTTALYVGSGATSLDIRNNILVNTQTATSTTQKNYAIYSAAANTAFTNINYNDYYVANSFNAGSAILGNIAATDRTTLAAVQAGFGGNAQSQNIAPVFTSSSDLHLPPASNATLDNLGTFIGSVLNDYDNDTRSVSTPDIGADEFTPVGCTTAVGGTASGSTSFCGSGTPTITATGYSTGSGSTYQWISAASAGSYPNGGSAVGGQTNPASLTTGVVSTTTYYWLRVTCSTNASTDNSTMVTVTVNPSAASITPSSVTFCSGSNATLTENGGTGTSWSWSTGATTQSISVSTAGTYTVTVTSPGPCTASASRIVSVNASPTVTGVGASPNPLCEGSTLNLASSGAPAVAGYAVASIAVSPETPSGSPTVLATGGVATPSPSGNSLDDGYWDGISLPFSFNFYGTSYSSVRIGTNGNVQFGAVVSTGGNPGNSSWTSQTIPTAGGYLDNFIAGPWCDHDLSTTPFGTLRYFTNGVTPNRKFVISWEAVHIYLSSDNNTSQIIINENGTIDVLLLGGGFAYTGTKAMGVENAGGTLGTAAPGRNSGTWTTGANEAWRFTPTSVTYAWSGPNAFTSALQNPTISNISAAGAGVYTVTVTDNNGCTVSGSTASVTVNTPPTVGGTVTNVSCKGGSNGAIDITPSGGTGPYSCSWTGPTFSAIVVTKTAAHPYFGTGSGLGWEIDGVEGKELTLVRGVTYTFSINAPGHPFYISTDPDGAGAGEWLTGVTGSQTDFGILTFTPDITAPSVLYYQCFAHMNMGWKINIVNGITNCDLTNLMAGGYSVTVTDANGCTGTYSGTVTEPATSVTASCNATPVSCFGGNNGTADVTAGGGTPGYTYLWSTTAVTSSIGGLTAGTYTVTVTDDNGCTATCESVVEEPASPVAANCSATPVSCFGGSNGTASVTGSGGTPGYTYLWSTTAVTSSIGGLTAGTYTVTVTDNNGCTATCESVVGGPASAVVATCSATPVSCFGGSNGTASVTGSGGTPGYTYLWSTTAVTSSIGGLTAGTYTVTVTDNNGCTATCESVVGGPASGVTATCSATPVSCFGGSNGTASVTGSGGTPGYTYLWSTTAVTSSIGGLTAGTYTVTVTDNNGCTATCESVVGGPASGVTATCSATPVSCFGGSNGTASVTGSGGTPGYTYLWSTTAVTSSIGGLTAGTYTVTVTDNNGCTATCESVVGGPASAVVATCSATPVSCFGGSNGTASVIGSGGTPGYTYLWSTTAVTSSIGGLTAGTYTVTVTDNNGCTATCESVVGGPASGVTATCSATPVSCFGGNNGTASVTGSGGTPGYTYLWSTTAVTSSIGGLTAGTYTVTVTDNNGCTATCESVITQPGSAISIPGTVTNVSTAGGNDGAVDITPSGGTPGYSYLWSNTATTQDISTLTAGTYTVTVTDNNGCTGTASFTVTEPGCTAPDITCISNQSASNGAGTCTAVVTYGAPTVTGTSPTVTYAFSGVTTGSGSGTGSGSTFNEGTTTVTLTATNGCGTDNCSFDVVVTVNHATAPTSVTSDDPNNEICAGQNVILTANGATLGTAGGSYKWYEGGCGTGSVLGSSSTLTVNNPSAGSHTYYVRIEEPGCPFSTTCSSITILVSGAPPSNSVGTPVTPSEACNGTVSLVSVNTVGGPNVKYSWNTGTNSSVVKYSTNIGGPFVSGPFQTNTNQVYAQFGALAGSSGYNICVQGVNACGSTNNKCDWIRGVVGVPGTITPPAGVVACPNDVKNYSCGASGGATVYNWTLGGSATPITSGQGTTNVSVTFPPAFTSAQLCVTAALSCGGSSTSAPRCVTVSKNPAVPGAFTAGPSSVCPGATGVVYTVPAVTGASGYSWTTPAGTTITSGQNTTSITVNFPNPYTGAPPVCVSATSACASSAARCKTVGSNIPGQPGSVAGPTTNVCNSTVQYSISNVTGATNYTWTNPAGTTITSGQTTTTILLSVSPSFVSGQLTVVANTNACTPGTSIPRTITINGKPNVPGTITANPAVWCTGGFVNFSVTPVSPLPTYNWTVSNGTITAGQGSNNIDVTWGATAAGTVNVNASNGCGTSSLRSQNFSSGCREESSGYGQDDLYSVYPNPAHGKVTVSIDAAESTDFTLQLMDVSGRVVLSENFAGTAGVNMYDLDLTALSKGVYMLEVKSAQNNWKTKMVVE